VPTIEPQQAKINRPLAMHWLTSEEDHAIVRPIAD
jgi:hypothetical protein